MIKKLDKHLTAVGRERDKLTDTINELEGLKDSCDRAYEDIQHARDALSEMV